MPPNEADMAAAKTPSESAPFAPSEDLKVQFSDRARGRLNDGKEVKLEIFGDGEKAQQSEYPALTKSELMEYANDPFWKGLRWSLFVFFWLVWLAMLVASTVIIIMAPKCPPPAPKLWWQKSPIYEVYVKSFNGSNGDGVGDNKGKHGFQGMSRFKMSIQLLGIFFTYSKIVVEFIRTTFVKKRVLSILRTRLRLVRYYDTKTKRGLKRILSISLLNEITED